LLILRFNAIDNGVKEKAFSFSEKAYIVFCLFI